MSNQTPTQPTGWTTPPAAPPRKRHIGRNIVLALVALLVLGGVIGALSGGNSTPNTAVTSPAATDGSSGVSKGLGTADATGDVTVVKGTLEGAYGIATAKLTIINQSAKRSDYYIEATLLDKAGDNIGTANALVSAVEPGQVAHAELTGTYTGKLASVKVTQVQRTASV